MINYLKFRRNQMTDTSDVLILKYINKLKVKFVDKLIISNIFI